MKKNIIAVSLLSIFIISCFIFFAFPAVKESNYYEGANGYKLLFGTVNVYQNGLWEPSRVGFGGIVTIILFFVSLIVDFLTLFLCLTGSDKWIVFFRIGLIATLLFSINYMWAAGSLPISLRQDGLVTYKNKPKAAGGAIFTGILGILVSLISAGIYLYKKEGF